MSKQWGHGYHTGSIEGYAAGEWLGETSTKYLMAQEMRVLFCALITAYSMEDSPAFWATVEIVKANLGRYAKFDDADWGVFRGKKRPAEEEK